MITINIIGAGKLGQTIAFLLQQSGLAQIAGICNQSRGSSQRACGFITAGIATATIADLGPADLTLITTPDDAIADCALALSHTNNLRPHGVVLHCSGSLSSSILQPLQARGLAIGSIHPAHSFATPAHSIQQFSGTYCSVSGDTAAVTLATSLFQAIGATVFSINDQHKARYHAANVFACGFVTTLFEQALQCLRLAEVPTETAFDLTHRLMQSTLDNLKQSRQTNTALTGPIARGDTLTLRRHLDALPSDQLAALYQQLSAASLPLATLSPHQISAIQHHLEASSETE